VGQQDGIAQGRQQHRGAELHLARARRHGGEQGQRIVPRPGQERIADPYGIEAQRLGALGKRQQRGGFGLSSHDPFAGRQQVSQSRHVAPLV
jgi:hypothetical protein